MDHEQLEQATRRTAVAPPKQDEGTAPAPSLGESAGNRAFANLVQRASSVSQGAGPLDPEIAADIDSARGGGQALDDNSRADMEAHLGADFSGVRVHADGRGDQLSRSVQAEAFTTGEDVFFKSGKYSPESSDGRRLLAHELTHVVQQGAGDVGGESRVSHPDDAHEVEAKSVGDAVAASPMEPSVAASVDRQATEDEEEEPMQMSVDRTPEEEEEMEM